MALTNSFTGLKRANPQAVGGLKANFVNIAFDNSYPTGGEAIVATGLGVEATDIVGVTIIGGNAASAAYRFTYDTANRKLLAYSGAAQVANATDLSAVTIRAIVWSMPFGG